jgi:hypothetical protein
MAMMTDPGADSQRLTEKNKEKHTAVQQLILLIADRLYTSYCIDLSKVIAL